MFLWYTETVFSWYIQSFVRKCAYFISLSNGNKLRSFTIPKRKWYLWGSKSVFVIILTLCLLIKVGKKKISSYIALSNWIWKIYHIDIILGPKLCQFVQFEISPSMSHKVFIFLKITLLGSKNFCWANNFVILGAWQLISNTLFQWQYQGPSWLWLYGSWIYNHLCNRCLSVLKL